MHVSPPLVFVRFGLATRERQADIPFGGVPQAVEHAQVPGGGGGPEQFVVEGVVRLVNVVEVEALVAEHGHVVLEATQVRVVEQFAGAAGDFRFELAA